MQNSLFHSAFLFIFYFFAFSWRFCIPSRSSIPDPSRKIKQCGRRIGHLVYHTSGDTLGLSGFHICRWYKISSWAIDRKMDRKSSASSGSSSSKGFSSQMIEEDIGNELWQFFGRVLDTDQPAPAAPCHAAASSQSPL